MPRIHILLILYLFAHKLQAQPADTTLNTVLNEVVVSSSRRPEPLIRAAASVVRVNTQWLKESAAAGPLDALENLRSVQLITAGLGFRIMNTRGFGNTTNVRLVHLADGMDIQSPHIGAPAGYALSPIDPDIESIEVLPGMAATLYGMNAINGLVSYRTRDPFLSTGLSIQQKTGLMRVGKDGINGPAVFAETAIRYATVINKKLAVKVNFSATKGNDWIAGDRTDLNAAANVSTGLSGADNPAADPVSSYGNESSNRRTLSLGGKQYVVSRTGYAEQDVAGDGISNWRGDATLSWRPRPDVTWSYVFRAAAVNSIYQRANRFRLEDYVIQQHGIQVRSPQLQANLYANLENTGNSYNLRSMAENLDRSFRTDNEWFAAYTSAFNQQILNGLTPAQAHRQARASADDGRLQPGSPAFRQTLHELQQINNWDAGAALKVRAAFIQGDFQWTPSSPWLQRVQEKSGVRLHAGGEIRTYIIHPDGNYFINPTINRDGKNLLYTKAGLFTSAERRWSRDRFIVSGALRVDRNDYFPITWSPRLSMVFTPDARSSWRISAQYGYRFPVIFEAFSNVNSGGVKRVGGLPVMSNGIFENAWLQSSIAAYQKAVLTDINSGNYNKTQAIARQQSLLVKNPYTYLRPEQVSSLETGHRHASTDGGFEWDADAHISRYESFIGQVNMNVPDTENPDSLGIALYDKTLQRPYRMWTNSTSRITIAGAGLSSLVRIRSNLTIQGNVNWNKLYRTQRQDGLEDGFNTPEWAANLTAIGTNRSKTITTTVTGRWQTAFYLQSFLVSGTVPAWGTVDAALGYSPINSKISFKTGASNLLNRYYRSYLGGPAIGGFYYFTVTYSPRP